MRRLGRAASQCRKSRINAYSDRSGDRLYPRLEVGSQPLKTPIKARSDSYDDGAEIQVALDHVWENGARAVAVRPRREGPGMVALQLWIGAGTCAERAGEHGAAHFVEHMLFKPIPSSRGGGDLAAAIEQLGGDVNAFTSHDETVIYASVPRRYANVGLRELLRHVLRPQMEVDEVEREREVILEEISEYEDDHASAASDSFLEGLFIGSEYGRPILGRRDDVRAISAEGLRRFHERVYTGDGVVLVVAGSMTHEDVLACASPFLESLPPRKLKGLKRPSKPAKGAVSWQRAGGHESHLRVGWQTPSLTHKDAPAMDVISAILSQGESALLPSRVRRQAKVVSDVFGSVTALRSAGSLMVSAETTPGAELRACTEIVQTVRGLCRDPVGADVLERAKAQILCAQAYRTETMEGLAHGVGHFVSQYGELEAEGRYFEQIRGVTEEDVRRVAARWIGVEAGLALIRSPNRRPREASAWARELAPVTISRPRVTKVKLVRERGGVSTARLPNGLTVSVLSDARVPVVASTLLWEGGGRMEEQGSAGNLWLASGLLTRGSLHRTGDQLSREIDAMAGELSGFASRDFAGIRAESMSRYFEPMIERALESVLMPSFLREEFEEERRVLLEELEGQADDTAFVVARTALRRAFGTHAYGRGMRGSAKTIMRLDESQIRAAWLRDHRLEDAVLAVAGDISPRDAVDRIAALSQRLQVEGVASAVVANGEPADSQRSALSWPARACSSVVRSTSPQQQAHLRLLFRGVPVQDPRVPALRILMAVLGDQSGRLFAALREDEGLVYSVGAKSVEALEGGYIAIAASARHERISRVRRKIRDVLVDVREHGISEAELRRATRTLVGEHERGRQRRVRLSVELAMRVASGRPWIEYGKVPRTLRMVTKEDVQKVAQALLDPARTVEVRSQDPRASG